MNETKIYFESGYLLDSTYERAALNQPIIAKQIPIFQNAWDRMGAQFITRTQQELGLRFRRSELTASIIKHPDVFSCSHPFLININRFKEFDPTDEAQAVEFCEIVYHESLHVLIDDNFPLIADRASPQASTMLRSMFDEDDTVLAHLHLYSVQERVFKKYGWSAVWDSVVANAGELHSPGYLRAIEIVQQLGGERFLAELSTNASN